MASDNCLQGIFEARRDIQIPREVIQRAERQHAESDRSAGQRFSDRANRSVTTASNDDIWSGFYGCGGGCRQCVTRWGKNAICRSSTRTQCLLNQLPLSPVTTVARRGI